MPTNRFRGDAPAVKQLQTVTPTNVTIGNIFTLTCNGKSYNFTATAATVANVTAGLVALVNASTTQANPEFAEVTAVDNTTNFTLTATAAGTPFTIASSAATGTGSPGCTLTSVTTTASSGPNDLSTAANWTLGLPLAFHDLVFDLPGLNIYWGLDVLAAVAPASMTFGPSWSGTIGLPDVSTGGYYEYRPKFFQHLCNNVTNNSASGRIKLDFGGTVNAVINALAMGSPLQGEPYAMQVKGTGNGSTLTILQGTVGVAVGPGEVSTLSTITTGYRNNPTNDVNLTMGAGVTWTTINQTGGNIQAQSSGTAWNSSGPGSQTLGPGTQTLGTLALNGNATFYWLSTGTITQATIGPKATLDNAQDPQAKTLGSCNLAGKINDPAGKIMCNGYTLAPGYGIEDVGLVVGKNRTVKVS